MNMQQFKGWVRRLLNALPWQRAPRASKSLAPARVTSPTQANHVTLPENRAARRQKVDTNPICSTLPQDEPAAQEPPPPLLLPAPRPPEASAFPLMALPPQAPGAADAAPSAEMAAESPQPPRVDPERRLAFARYLFKRGVFNEGFARETLPAQYWDQMPDA